MSPRAIYVGAALWGPRTELPSMTGPRVKHKKTPLFPTSQRQNAARITRWKYRNRVIYNPKCGPGWLQPLQKHECAM